jgi:hypothetical protein
MGKVLMVVATTTARRTGKIATATARRARNAALEAAVTTMKRVTAKPKTKPKSKTKSVKRAKSAPVAGTKRSPVTKAASVA